MMRKLMEDYSRWGPHKTEPFVIGERTTDLQMSNDIIKGCREYKDLGSYSSEDGNIERNIKNKIAKYHRAIQHLN
ncbi:hypothetical protein ABEB36_008214 [Hypothenemus hampei]|uniref:Uncharacterized protein n=1 Tax=Hypothenemus hampei TaxID=57062 RepID=A0ABD1ENB6_HYPHA